MRILTRELLTIYAERGAVAYLGESVSVTEHALQCAHFAQSSGAHPELIIAALLHDIGHVLCTTDARHESSGAQWLAAHFSAHVSEPVRLHVAAKRYLCAIESGYASILSQASVDTLQLQGGVMSSAEIAAFEIEPFHREAVQIRRWDDGAKIAGLSIPDFNHYAPLLERISMTPSSAI